VASGNTDTTLARRGILPVLLLLAVIPTLAIAQDDDPRVDQDPPPPNDGVDQVLLLDTPEIEPTVGSWSERADAVIGQIIEFEKDAEDADELILEIDKVLKSRLYRINERMKGARSPTELVSSENELPPEIVTIADLHANINDLYRARIRLLEHTSPDLHLEFTASDVIGVQQLTLEIQFIWEQIRFRALNLPAASKKLQRRIQIAPLPVIGQFIKFLLVVALFRWWRNWFPETLRRMRASLAEIRPRSPAIMRRIRLVWYIDQVRRPLEWLLLFHVLFSMVDMPGLNLLVSIIAVVVRWVLLGWFSVSLINAVAARGDAGLTGTDARVRLRSLRLLATWLVLLGLGLSIAQNLAGVATLHAWVWRLFQFLALPVFIVLLSWWREPIFTRLGRVRESNESIDHLLQHQKGLRSYRNAASGAIWLLAQGLRRKVLRMFLHVGADQAIPFSGKAGEVSAEPDRDIPATITDEMRTALLTGDTGYERHARFVRRSLNRRIKSNQGGVVAIVGERGIGKSAFLQSLRAQLEERIICLECQRGNFTEIEEGLATALSIEETTPASIAEGLTRAGTRVIAIDGLHRLVRPVIGGQADLTRLTKLVEDVQTNILWVFTVDSFAWQFIRRARADQSTITDVIELPAWSEEQLTELIDQRNSEASIDAEFGNVQIPAEHAVTTLDTPGARSKAGIYRMLWTFSGGNPAVALRLWANCLYYDEHDHLCVRTPAHPVIADLDSASHNVLLVLRSIAQSEMISEKDIVDNLRLPSGAVSSAIHYCVSRGWIEDRDGRYWLSMDWFRTITRTLARHNLLAR